MRNLHESEAWPGDAVVAVTRLSRRFWATKALDDVTLGVRRGCVFGLVGENGAGKSTLIKPTIANASSQSRGLRSPPRP